jgi:rhodanese-related sulfurtransferase
MSSKLAADAHDLKSRLEWGQPSFTILDVRDRHTYNHGRIAGSIQIPLDELAQRAKSSLHTEREIYVYGADDSQSAHAVEVLQGAGFKEVGVIPGGLAAWKTVGGATEGVGA